MIEIATEVDLFHPPARIWRALTEQALLAKWFAGSESLGDRTLLRTGGLPGYDADTEVEVVELRAPERLVLRCREGDRSTRLACDLAPIGHGCRLSVREVLEEGDWDADRRTEQHQRAVTGRLPAILDWLAFQEVDLRRAEGGLTAELPVVRPGEARGRTGRLVLLAAGVLAMLGVAAGATVWATRPAPTAPAAAPASTPPSSLAAPATSSTPPRATPSRPTPSASRRSVAPSPTASAAPTRTSSPSPRPVASLAASYETVSDRVFGYRGQVVLRNPGPAAKQDWTVTVTLGDDATVSSVNGAEAKQDGAVVTFTGAAVPAGGSTTIRFDVRDPDLSATGPEGCTVDGAACAGL
ncbi:SRPBCC domain-containing protein [Micromonospora halotolerans]|uniref:SRPBCC domain-containing protein n=1 Tax=Micromonospora halotolerans TaxID=709879 RepID=A0ABY9ZW19_9ACTN|nr:SRPBCC domain-containing protein [Micromonospora halotolerans]WNM39484.1 SRPBCC domain-containing protein [Micromonospora halotolerans]